MKTSIKTASGWLVLSVAMPALAQQGARPPATPASGCASCPSDTPGFTHVPDDPTFIVVAFLVGAALGYAAAKLTSRGKTAA